MPENASTEIVLSLEELATELDVRPRHLEHVLARGMLPFIAVEGNAYRVDSTELAEQKERNRIGREELRYAFAHPDEIRQRLVRELAGVDEETAKRLGY